MDIDPETRYVKLTELSEILQVPMSWLYERSRRNAIPGQRRLGAHIRIDLEEFRKGLKNGDMI